VKLTRNTANVLNREQTKQLSQKEVCDKIDIRVSKKRAKDEQINNEPFEDIQKSVDYIEDSNKSSLNSQDKLNRYEELYVKLGLQPNNHFHKKQKDVVLNQVEQEVPIVSNQEDDISALSAIFYHLQQAYLSQAQEFRAQGYNRFLPQVDFSLCDELELSIQRLENDIEQCKGSIEPKLCDDVRIIAGKLRSQLECFSQDQVISWLKEHVKSKSKVEKGGVFEQEHYGSRKIAQSLVRRLEAGLKTMNLVALSLSDIVTNGDATQFDINIERELIRELAHDYYTEHSIPLTSQQCIQLRNKVNEDIADVSKEQLVLDHQKVYQQAEQAYSAVLSEQTLTSELDAIKLKTEQDERKDLWLQICNERSTSVLEQRLTHQRSTCHDVRRELSKLNEKLGYFPFPLRKRTLEKDVSVYLTVTEVLLKEALKIIEPEELKISERLSTQVRTLELNLPNVKDKAQSLMSIARIKQALSNFEQKVEHKVEQANSNLIAVGNKLKSKSYVSYRVIDEKIQIRNENQRISDSIVRSALWQMQQSVANLQQAALPLLASSKALSDMKSTLPETFKDDFQPLPPTTLKEILLNKRNLESPIMKAWSKQKTLDDLIEKNIKQVTKAINKFENNEISDIDVRAALKQSFYKEFNKLTQELAFALDLTTTMRNELTDRCHVLLMEGSPPLLEVLSQALFDVIELLKQAVEKASSSQDFSKVKELTERAVQKAGLMKAKLAECSAQETGRDLDDTSRGARLAKSWAMALMEKIEPEQVLPSTGRILSLIQECGLDKETLSSGDPVGTLIATRLAINLMKAQEGTLSPFMTPEQYADHEKDLVEFMVTWGQRRFTHGLAGYAFELALNIPTAFTFSIFSSLYRLPLASIKIPYKVYKTKSLTMPGSDQPYKAINMMVKKRMKQLGFHMIMSPLPTPIKLAGGAAFAGYGYMFNGHIAPQEKTLDSTFDRLVNGVKSQKLQMESVSSLAMRSVTALTTSGLKNIHNQVSTLENREEININVPGDKEFQKETHKVLGKLKRTKVGEMLLNELHDKGVTISYSNNKHNWLRRESEHDYYASETNTQSRTIFFDPWNTLSSVDETDLPERPWLKRDPSIVLFHEMLHIYYAIHPVKIKYEDSWWPIEQLGEVLAPEGTTEEQKQALSQNVLEHFMSGADYEHHNVTLSFSLPEFIACCVDVKNGTYMSENQYRNEYYLRLGEEVILRTDYGDSNFVGHHTHRYAPSRPKNLEALSSEEFEEIISATFSHSPKTDQLRVDALKWLLAVKWKEHFKETDLPDGEVIYFDRQHSTQHRVAISNGEWIYFGRVYDDQIKPSTNGNLVYIGARSGSEYRSITRLEDGRFALSDSRVLQDYIHHELLNLNGFPEEVKDVIEVEMSKLREHGLDESEYLLRLHACLEALYQKNKKIKSSFLLYLMKAKNVVADTLIEMSVPKSRITGVSTSKYDLSDEDIALFDAFNLPSSNHPSLFKPLVSYQKYLLGGYLVRSQEEFDTFLRNELKNAKRLSRNRSLKISEFGHSAIYIIKRMQSERGKILNESVVNLMDMIKASCNIDDDQLTEESSYRAAIQEIKVRQSSHLSPFDKIMYKYCEQAFLEELEKKHMYSVIKAISTDQRFSTFRVGLLPSEVLYIQSHPLVNSEVLISNILEYRTGERSTLHEDIGDMEQAHFDSLKDRPLPSGEIYSRQQQIDEIKHHGGLIEYEREVIRANRIIHAMKGIELHSLTRQFWNEQGISEPDKVKYIYNYLPLPANNLYTMPDEESTRAEQVKRLNVIGKGDVSYYRIIGSKMGPHYLHSVNREELSQDNINWDIGSYYRHLKVRLNALVESQSVDRKEYLDRVLPDALNPPRYTTSRGVPPYFIKPHMYDYPLENMLLLKDGEKYTLISLLPPSGQIEVFDGRGELEAFFTSPNNHEFILSHASMANQMDDAFKSGLESALKGSTSTGDNEEVVPDNSKYRMNGQNILFNIARSSVGEHGRGHFIKTDLGQAAGASYWEGISGSHEVMVSGGYELPSKYKDSEGNPSFEKLYEVQKNADIQRLAERNIQQFKEEHFDTYSAHLRSKFEQLVRKAKHNRELNPFGGEKLIQKMLDEPSNVNVSIPGLMGKFGEHVPLEGMLLVNESGSGRYVMVSLLGNGALIEFDNKEAAYHFFANPANRRFILSHISEYDKQPALLREGETPVDTLNYLETVSEKYPLHEGVGVFPAWTNTTRLYRGKDRVSIIPPSLTPTHHTKESLEFNFIPLSSNSHKIIFDTVADRNLKRLSEDADALFKSHAEWKAEKALEITGGVLAVPAAVLTIASVIASGGTATPAIATSIAAMALAVDVASFGVNVAEGIYLLTQTDTPEEQMMGFLPLCLAPVDLLGVTSSVGDLLKAAKIGTKTVQVADKVSDLTKVGIEDLSNSRIAITHFGKVTEDTIEIPLTSPPKHRSSEAIRLSDSINQQLNNIRRGLDELDQVEPEVNRAVVGSTQRAMPLSHCLELMHRPSRMEKVNRAIESGPPEKAMKKILALKEKLGLTKQKNREKLTIVVGNFIEKYIGDNVNEMSFTEIQENWLKNIDIPLRNNQTMSVEEIISMRQHFPLLIRQTSDDISLRKIKNALDELPTTKLCRYGDVESETHHYPVTTITGEPLGTIKLVGPLEAIRETHRALEDIYSTSSGKTLLQDLAKDNIRIQLPTMAEVNRVDENGRLYAKNSAAGRVVSFDPENRILGSNIEEVRDFPFKERSPSVALFHELLHIYNAKYPLIIPKFDGRHTKVSGGGSLYEESRIIGGKYMEGSEIYDFSSEAYVDRYRQNGGVYLTENIYRKELAQNKGEAPIYRPYYGDGLSQIPVEILP